MNIVTEPKLSGKPIGEAQRKRPVRPVRWFLIVGTVLAALVAGLVFFIASSASNDSSNTAADGSTTLSTTTTTRAPAGPFKVITGVNVRTGPGPNFPVVGLIETGFTVTAICVVPDGPSYAGPAGQSTSWLRVTSIVPSAWVASPYVATGGAIDDPKVIPVCTAAQRAP